jgi:ADP-ribose pyrophosphatase YjhB (NUDIX family)
MHARLPVAVHIFLLRDNHVLLLRRANTGYEDGKYSVVAGHLDGGESVTQAAIREAHEEVGITLRLTDLTVVGVMHRVSTDERIDFFLVATTWGAYSRIKSQTSVPNSGGVLSMLSRRIRFPMCGRRWRTSAAACGSWSLGGLRLVPKPESPTIESHVGLGRTLMRPQLSRGTRLL